MTGGPRRGRTSVTARAVNRLALALAADAAGVSAREASVTLDDQAGSLSARLLVPALTGTGETFAEQGARIQQVFVARMAELGGRRVSSVDVRFGSVIERPEKRVR